MGNLISPSVCYTFPPHSVISVALLTEGLDKYSKSYAVAYSATEITVTVMAEVATKEEAEN